MVTGIKPSSVYQQYFHPASASLCPYYHLVLLDVCKKSLCAQGHGLTETSVHWPGQITPGQLRLAHQRKKKKSLFNSQQLICTQNLSPFFVFRCSSKPFNAQITVKHRIMSGGTIKIISLTSCGLVLNRLFEQSDVSEGAEEKHHLVIFISDWGDLHVKPDRRFCGKQSKWESCLKRTDGSYWRVVQETKRVHITS